MGTAKISPAACVRCPTVIPVESLRRLRDPAPPVAGLLLDVGGVLYDDTVWSRWLLKLVTRQGLHTCYTPFFRVWQREYLQRVTRGELEYWQALRLFLRAAGLSHGQVDEVEAAGHARRRECEAEIFPLPGVVHVLASLRNLSIQLTVLSSGCLETAAVQQQLAKLGIGAYFHAILTHADIARTESAKRVMEVAVAHTGLMPRQLCYVGRDTATLGEASTAGIRTVAVNYDDDAEADIYLGHFEQLLGLLPWQTARAMAG